MVIWHISDTHGYHDLLKIPEGIDMVIFSGDAGNVRDPYRNEHEVRTFLLWFSMLPIQYKIMISGNHDSSIEKRLITSSQMLMDYNIMYLEDELIELDNLKIYGSPWTPTFNNWSFMKKREKMHQVWQEIPEDVDILITHGPPKGILDLSDERGSSDIHWRGDLSLLKRVKDIEPTHHLFGHIHNFKDHINQGTRKLSNYKTIFSNGSVICDNKFGKLSSNGNIFEII